MFCLMSKMFFEPGVHMQLVETTNYGLYAPPGVELHHNPAMPPRYAQALRKTAIDY